MAANIYSEIVLINNLGFKFLWWILELNMLSNMRKGINWIFYGCRFQEKYLISSNLMDMWITYPVLHCEDRRLTKHGTFTEFTELRKIPINTEMSVVLLTKHEYFDISWQTKDRSRKSSHPWYTEKLENSGFICVFLRKHGNVGAVTDNYYYGNGRKVNCVTNIASLS